jgi:PhnB protein
MPQTPVKSAVKSVTALWFLICGILLSGRESITHFERRWTMALIHAYLRFHGNAKEAFAFYQACLGGELSIQTVGQSPMAQFMPDKKDHVFHAQLQHGDLVLLGSDMVGEEGLIKGNTMVLTLECSSKEETETLFAKLSAGGMIGHPLTEQPFGLIGDFTDKFGVDWFVVGMSTPSNT